MKISMFNVTCKDLQINELLISNTFIQNLHASLGRSRWKCNGNWWELQNAVRLYELYLFQEFPVSEGGLLDKVPHSPPLLAGHHHTCLPKRHCHLHRGTLQCIRRPSGCGWMWCNCVEDGGRFQNECTVMPHHPKSLDNGRDDVQIDNPIQKKEKSVMRRNRRTTQSNVFRSLTSFQSGTKLLKLII